MKKIKSKLNLNKVTLSTMSKLHMGSLKGGSAPWGCSNPDCTQLCSNGCGGGHTQELTVCDCQ